MQKFPAEEFTATTKLSFKPNTKLVNEKTGLVVMGQSYAGLVLKSEKDGISLVSVVCKKAIDGKPEKEATLGKFKSGKDVYLRVKVEKRGLARFSFSRDGKQFEEVGEVFQTEPGKWIGAKVGIFCTRDTQINDSGYADYDWFRIE
jgi:hypothetical protein